MTETITPADDLSAAVLGTKPEDVLLPPSSTADADRKTRTCSLCNQQGHDMRTCPQNPVADATQRRRGRPAAQQAIAQWTDDDIAAIGACIAMVLLQGTVWLEHGLSVGRIRMEREEAESIGGAATRIVMRRVRIPGAKKGDALDVVIIVTTLSAYIMRISELTYSKTTRRNNEPASNGAVQSEQRTPAGLYVGAGYFTNGHRGE